MSIEQCCKCGWVVDTDYEEVDDSLLGPLCLYCLDQVERDIDEAKLED